MNDFKLDNHPKISSGFKVPDGYFDTLSEKIAARLNEPEEIKVMPLYARRKTWVTAAAAVLVLALMIPFLQRNNIGNATLDDSSIENYLSYQTNISQYDLVSLLDNTDIEKLESNLPIEDEAIEDILISNNNFENYITD